MNMLRTTSSLALRASQSARRGLSTNPAAENHAFLNGFSPEQTQRALQRGAEIRARHVAAAESFPASSQGEREIGADEANRKRVIYRSKQRGWLEVDLLLGSWAAQHVMALSAAELAQYEDILNEETIDIFNYVSGKSPLPERLDTPVMKRLQEYCFSSPLGKASVEGFAANKKFMSN